MENIFENAYFGKPYKTRDGRKALYIYTHSFCHIGELIDVVIENDVRGIRVYPNGKLRSINMCKHDESESNLDIVSEWEEETNVDELAFNYAIKDVPKKDEVTVRLIEQAFKAGYYTAKNIKDSNMNNIFENAYFGKPYKTRGGKKAIFWKSMNSNNTDIALLCEDFCISVNPNGIIDDVCFGDTFPNKHDYDIVSEWKEEEIDEEELDKMAEEYVYSYGCENCSDGIVCFKEGYRKAKNINE